MDLTLELCARINLSSEVNFFQIILSQEEGEEEEKGGGVGEEEGE